MDKVNPMNKSTLAIQVTLAIMTTSAGAWAQGGFEGPGRYVITSVRSGKVLDLDRNDRTTVLQFSPRGTNNQAWEIRPTRGGYFFIRNMMNGYALTVVEERNGAPLQGTPFNGSEAQMFRFEGGKDGNAVIFSRIGRALDVPGGTSRDGARINVFDPNGDSNQRWVLARTSGDWGRREWDWDEDRRGDRRDEDRREPGLLRCSSDDGQRTFCEADTGRGVRLVRQISGSPCEEGRTWGYDRRGIWVDRGCRGEFAVDRR